MPNPFGLVAQVLEPDLDQWRHIVVFIKKKERHLGCVFGVKRKVVCLLFRDIRHSQRHRRPFQRGPVHGFWFRRALIHEVTKLSRLTRDRQKVNYGVLKRSRTQEEPTVSRRGPHRSILEFLSSSILKPSNHTYGTLYLPICAPI